jgi:hypothetical protein
MPCVVQLLSEKASRDSATPIARSLGLPPHFQFTKMYSSSKLTFVFLRPKSPYRFRRLLTHIATAVNKIESLSIVFIQPRLLIFAVSPLNIQFLKREVILATRLRHAKPTETFHTWLSNSSRSVMKITIMLHENYSKHLVVYILNINVFVFFHIQGLHISARTLSDFRRSPALFELPISHSVNSDVQIYFIYLMSHTALLWFIFIALRVLDGIMSYGRSKHVIKVNDFDRSNFLEGRDVDISISSKKIKTMLYGNHSKLLVVYIPNINVFVSFHIQGLYAVISKLTYRTIATRSGNHHIRSRFLFHFLRTGRRYQFSKVVVDMPLSAVGQIHSAGSPACGECP